MLALGGLALGTYFLYGGRMAQKEIEKGPLRLAASARARAATIAAIFYAPSLTLSPATGGEEIKSTADHVKRAYLRRACVLVAPCDTARRIFRRRGREGNEGRSGWGCQASLNVTVAAGNDGCHRTALHTRWRCLAAVCVSFSPHLRRSLNAV